MLSISKRELELRSRACMLLEKTKNMPKKYVTERNKLLSLGRIKKLKDTDYVYWDEFISKVEDLISSQEEN